MRKRGRALSPRSSSATGARCVGAAGECTTGFLTHWLSCAKPEEEDCFCVANSILHTSQTARLIYNVKVPLLLSDFQLSFHLPI